VLALESGDGLWRRPAEAPLSPSLTTTVEVGPKESGRLHRFGVNTFMRGPGGSLRLHGRVCLEPNSTVPRAWQQLDTRRFVLFVLGSVERATRWVTRGPVDAAACARLVAQVRNFLAELHARGALHGSRAEQAYYLRVTRRRSGTESAVTLRFGFAPLEPGHFEVYEIVYAPGSARTRAVAPLEGGISDAPSR
jgi:phage tail sheath protein FI